MDDDPLYQPTHPRQYESTFSNSDGTVPATEAVYLGGQALIKIPSHRIPFARDTNQYGDPHFIQSLVRVVDFNFIHSTADWQYKKRQIAQEILPFLLLGPMSFARDGEEVRKAGITMMVAVRSKVMVEKIPNLMNPAKYASAINMETTTFDVDTAFDLSMGRSSIIRAINDHLMMSTADQSVRSIADIPGKVLVFCETGNERSAVLVVMYLMVMWGLDAISACQLVQGRRFGICLRPEMVHMLRNLDNYLEAERQAGSGNLGEQPAGLIVRGRKFLKRSMAQRNDSDTDMENGVDDDDDTSGQVSLRPGVAPFSD